MTESDKRFAAQRTEVIRLITDIESARSLYFIAQKMGERMTQTQVERMKDSGRCQPWQLAVLRETWTEVSRETSQNVINKMCLLPNESQA